MFFCFDKAKQIRAGQSKTKFCFDKSGSRSILLDLLLRCMVAYDSRLVWETGSCYVIALTLQVNARRAVGKWAFCEVMGREMEANLLAHSLFRSCALIAIVSFSAF